MICFFINDGKLLTVKYVSNTSDEIIEISKTDFQRYDHMKYEIFKGYEDIEDDNQKLISLKKDFLKWSDEIRNLYLEDNALEVYKYNQISFLVDCFFFKYSKKKIENLKLTHIDYIESEWMNKCYNNGINYLKDSTLYTDCYGYDFKSFYPTI